MNKLERDGFHRVEFDPENDGCNVNDDVIMQQVRRNITLQLPQAMPHQPNGYTVALVCGGPSLAKTVGDLREVIADGAKVIATNGAYQWCLDNKIRPSGMIMLDARQFNARFVEKPVAGCKYFLASQCHPDAFELCKDRDTTIFHCCSGGEEEYLMLKKYYFGRLNPVPLGTTVAIKGIQLLSMLGFKRIDIFGMDSCWMGDEHHSYPQAENDHDKYMPVWLSPDSHPHLAERFWCAPWMMRQAIDFQNLVRERGDDFELNVRGEGLIAAILRIAATLGTSTVKEGD